MCSIAALPRRALQHRLWPNHQPNRDLGHGGSYGEPQLKAAGVPVTLREYLTFMEAMQQDLAVRRSRTSTICRVPHW
jgi:hypothetical protein